MLDSLIQELNGLDVVGKLKYLASKYENKIVFSTSFGWEDQVITHLIFENNIPIKVFTLDTGRLFTETYYVWNRTLEIYGKPIHAYFPQADAIQNMLQEKGPNSFYESVENRKECCYIRKIEPLKRALRGNEIWVTGIRADQSNNRMGMQDIEWDEGNRIIKFHPLFDWSLEDVKDFTRMHQVVYNPLHNKGFVSIGCAPCTRAIKSGEDFRAGRWWWEDQSKKECGLHQTSN
ncbi:MAG: phosphoadenylyl-sulfate reductase [Bacteroidia bacterium]|nr:MAG: phosphoadenylyl-sulfate reductase [Bacteroidia bacterium]